MHEDRVGLDTYCRETLRKLGTERPVRSGAAPVEQSRSSQQERPRANGGDAPRVLGPPPNPVDQRAVGRGRSNTIAAGNDQRVQRRSDRWQSIRGDPQSGRGDNVRAALRHDPEGIGRRTSRLRNDVVRRCEDLQRPGDVEQLHLRESDDLDHTGRAPRRRSW